MEDRDSKHYAEGNNLQIRHPLPVKDSFSYPVQGGAVNIFQYSDDTVLIQIMQDGKQPTLWVNRKFTVDALLNTVNIIPKNF
ncbi:hypothetical protein [Paenibacillus paeoniae]|uniref:Uncharacterized protein n=1 Tax=Paenibacillus paeoniae TaxID=2292705 RepID=A0A371P090_9BACL|nr:hypothetical protein [Paenibacillus paeoniae]REK69349.1 hypothetical protein DX130_24625 [Paenibacillus paeoniae]